MDSSLSIVVTRNSKSKHCHASVHNRVDAVNDNNKPSNNRDNSSRYSRVSLNFLQWYKHHCDWRQWYRRYRYSLCTNKQCSRLGFTDHRKSRRHDRNNKHRQNYHNRRSYFVLLYLLSIGTPVLAEGETNNNSNPVAAATGNVTNQAVQFQNNGAQSRQYYGPNISCNGSTMTFQPFYMGNHTKPLDEFMQPTSYTLAENWGFQINFMVPLDKSGYKQCKEMAKLRHETMKLEYEITRAGKCADLQRKGFTYRPGTKMAKVCQDIVPISSLQPPKKKKFWQK